MMDMDKNKSKTNKKKNDDIIDSRKLGITNEGG